ncbi:MAG: exodeoxyribonuclease VII large subunit, partial [Actinobacteria bacterium]|nr:exodeoxyribonuclease VII large subunit [Actinomycetota bacterium]
EPILYGDRKVYTVSGFNRGVASWLERLPTVWVEGEVTELRRQAAWQSVFFTLKDAGDGACLSVSIPRAAFDALRLDLADGMTVHVFGRPELFAARGQFRLRALSIEPLGLGALLAGIERLKHKLAGEGLFAPERKRTLPLFPRRVALVTGNEAAAKHDFVTAVVARLPSARVLIAPTYVQGPHAASAIAAALAAVVREPEVDVVVLARGGGSFEDLLPFSDERVVRAVAASPVPVVSAVGHEQDTPLCDLAADARASTPTAAARLVVPDEQELRKGLASARERLERGGSAVTERARERLTADGARLARSPTVLLERARERLDADHERLRRAPPLLLERRHAALEGAAGRLHALSPRATLSRGYAIVRLHDEIVRTVDDVSPADRVEVELGGGGFGARVEEIRP